MEEEVSMPFKEVWKIVDAGCHHNDDDNNKGNNGPTPPPGGATKKVNCHLIFNWGIVNMNMTHLLSARIKETKNWKQFITKKNARKGLG
jgi:hypothetical protein